MHAIHQIWIVAAAGAAGAVCRFALASGLVRWTGGAFPWGTLAVNLLGCLAIGRFLASGWASQEGYRLAIGIGFLGSFTTFSAVEAEAFFLLRQGRFAPAAGYLIGSVLLGLIAVWIGWRWGCPPQLPGAGG